MLETGKIRRSKSPAAAPILFVLKAHSRGLPLCVNYREINKITIVNRYLLPIMSELPDRVRVSKIFTKIDRKTGYHLIRIKEGDKWKAAFRCRYGLDEFFVMPVGLINALASFQDMMNHILMDLFDKGVVVYIDDILIYAKNEDIDDELVKEVLERLAKNDLVISLEKCIWEEEEVEFLGYIYTPQGRRMAKDKTKAIQEWRTPKSLRDVQSILGFANFYRHFILGFPKICCPLTESTKGDKKDWEWTPDMETLFVDLTERFTTDPILTHL
jgi:hypothetical protein